MEDFKCETSVSTGKSLNNNKASNYNYITITIKNKDKTFSQGKKFPILHIYVPPEFVQVHEKLKEIAKRENISISRLFWRWATHYVSLHAPGNPQQRLDKILEQPKPYKAKPLCGCGKLAEYKALIGNNWIVLCRKCLRRKGNTVLGYKPLEELF